MVMLVVALNKFMVAKILNKIGSFKIFTFYIYFTFTLAQDRLVRDFQR